MIQTDNYYNDCAATAVADILDQFEGEDPAFIRKQMASANPFQNDKSSKARRAWLNAVHDAEKQLGLEPRRHSTTIERERQATPTPAPRKKSRIGRAHSDATSLDELHRMYPSPSDATSASLFLRQQCRAIVAMLEDADLLRITLKTADGAECDCKFEYKAELSTNNPAERDAVFIKAAQKAHAFWIAQEEEKF
jgi:hypothetical protein